MPSHRSFLRYKFIFAGGAILTFLSGLVVLTFLIIGAWKPANGEWNGRYRVLPTQALTVIQNERIITSTPPATYTPQADLPVIPGSSRGLLTNGSRDEYKIALTFDFCEREGEPAGYDSEIIRILRETQSPATLFLGGLWMQNHHAETLELASHPLFELGNHSWSHPDFNSLSSSEMQQEILLTQQMMYELLGYQTNLFRLPYGTYTDEALEVINDQGLYIIQWDSVSGDPDPDIGAKEMTAWVLQQVQPGSIIIMHANGRGWHTAEALPGMIQALRDQGYTLVTVSELLNIEPYK